MIILCTGTGNVFFKKNYNFKRYWHFSAFSHFSAGLAVGICGLASGWCIGVLGDFGSRSSALRPQLFMTSVLMTGFAMVLGMYGLIVALLQGTK